MFDYVFEFDINPETKNICHEINSFWSGAEDRLDLADGNIYKCVARLISHEIIRLQLKSSFYCGVEPAIEAFSKGDIEGFYPIDGSCGIRLLYADDFELQELGVEFSEK